MTEALANTNKTTLNKLSEITQLSENNLSRIFSSFHIDQGYQAHANLMKKILDVFSSINYPKLMSSLEDFDSVFNLVHKAKDMELPHATSHTSSDTVVEVSGDRALINFVMLPTLSGTKKSEATNLLSTLAILAIWSDSTKEPEDLQNIIDATNHIRLSQSKNNHSSFEEFVNHLNPNIQFYTLANLITSEATRIDHTENKRLFKSIQKILPLIKVTNNRKTSTVHLLPRKKTQNIESDIEDNFDLVIKNNTSDSDESDSTILSKLDDSLADIDKEEISSDLKKQLKKVPRQLTKELSETKQNLAKSINTHPLTYSDKNHLNYSTNLFNPIERKWLLQALKSPIDFDGNDATSLILTLSISLNKKVSDVLNIKLSTSESEVDGTISINGYYIKKIPEAEKPIHPANDKQYLYLPHANDQETEKYITLELPEFIKTMLKKLRPKETKEIKLFDLFDKNHEDTPEIQINRFIKSIQIQHGHRFNKNRFSCQLKQFINSKLNDPTITFAIFGNSEQRAPPAYYYRAISLKELIKCYKKLSTEYFS